MAQIKKVKIITKHMATITDISNLNPNHFYIVVYNIDAYAEGITGRNYNMVVYHSSNKENKQDTDGWKTKKDLAKVLTKVKKDNKSSKVPNSTKGQFNTIKVMKPQEMIEDYNKDVIRFSIFIQEAKVYN